jgi:hypothetical protein
MKITQVEAIHLRFPAVDEQAGGSQDTQWLRIGLMVAANGGVVRFFGAYLARIHVIVVVKGIKPRIVQRFTGE